MCLYYQLNAFAAHSVREDIFFNIILRMEKLPWATRAKVPSCFCSAHLTHLLSSTSTISQWPHSSQRATGRLLSLFGSCAGQKSGLSCGASAARETTLEPYHLLKASLVEEQLCKRQWCSRMRTWSALRCVAVNVRWHGCVTGTIPSLIRPDLDSG